MTMLILLTTISTIKKKNIIVILCAIVFASCEGQVRSDSQTNRVKQSVSKNIRTDTTSIWNSFYNVRQLGRQIKLDPGEVGFDSLQIRVWFDYSLARKKRLIIIEGQNNKWNGRLYEINVRYVDTLNYDIVERYNKKEIEPISGWQKFISELYRLKIDELSDTSRSGADGTTYCVEILTATTYTYYSFWEPEYTKSFNKQSANMVNIIALLEREFRLDNLKGR